MNIQCIHFSSATTYWIRFKKKNEKEKEWMPNFWWQSEFGNAHSRTSLNLWNDSAMLQNTETHRKQQAAYSSDSFTVLYILYFDIRCIDVVESSPAEPSCDFRFRGRWFLVLEQKPQIFQVWSVEIMSVENENRSNGDLQKCCFILNDRSYVWRVR